MREACFARISELRPQFNHHQIGRPSLTPNHNDGIDQLHGIGLPYGRGYLARNDALPLASKPARHVCEIIGGDRYVLRPEILGK